MGGFGQSLRLIDHQHRWVAQRTQALIRRQGRRCQKSGPLWENWAIAEVATHNALLGSPAELFFWRTRTQSEVDLVAKQGDSLRAFEIKWSQHRISGRAFRDAYGVDVEPIRPANPFATEIFRKSAA